MLPDVILHEITAAEGGIDAILKEELGHLYDMQADQRVCPTRLGYPVMRKRRVTSLWKKSTTMFVGSWLDFWKIFEREVMVSVEDYCVDLEGSRRAMCDASARRGHHLTFAQDPILENCLAPGIGCVLCLSSCTTE